MAAKKNLQMVFLLEDGKKASYNLVEPKDDISRAAVEGVMNDMIAKNVILKNASAASRIEGIYVKATDTVEL